MRADDPEKGLQVQNLLALRLPSDASTNFPRQHGHYTFA
jgi:hypothetical protein